MPVGICHIEPGRTTTFKHLENINDESIDNLTDEQINKIIESYKKNKKD